MQIDNKIVPYSNLDLPDRYKPNAGYNLNQDIYVPLLANSKLHKRFTYGFSSRLLEEILPGVEGLIMNEGSMQLVFGQVLDHDDYKHVKQAIEDRDGGLEYVCLDLLDQLIAESKEKKGQDFHLRLLSALIGSRKLEIKFAFKLVESKRPFLHSKMAYFEGSNSEEVAWEGSNNASKNASEEHYESFAIFQTHRPEAGSQIHIPDIKIAFETMWEGKEEEWDVAEVNSEFYEKWEKAFKQPTKKEINEAFEAIKKRIKNRGNTVKTEQAIDFPEDFWEHKKKAVNKFKSSKKGILEMATGTGKTSTALEIARHLILEKQIDSLILCVKDDTLLFQWELEIEKWLRKFSIDNFLIRKQFNKFKELDAFLLSPENSILILRQHHNPDLERLLNEFATETEAQRCLMIHDEVHNMGARQKTELPRNHKGFGYVLGLSATSNRGEFDEEGNAYILEEIGETIFTYTLEDAIRDGDALCEFNYIPLSFSLTETDKQKISEAFARDSAAQKNGTWDPMMLPIDISRITKTAEMKPSIFKEFISQHNELLQSSIVFTETIEQGDLLKDTIDSITNDWKTFYGGDDMNILDEFSKGFYDCLLACGRLSEGVDISRIKNIFLIASDREKREVTQRIGRCLRKDPLDITKRATVVDFIKDLDIYLEDEANEKFVDDADIERYLWLNKVSKVRAKK